MYGINQLMQSFFSINLSFHTTQLWAFRLNNNSDESFNGKKFV
jgi:hypothetical protein